MGETKTPYGLSLDRGGRTPAGDFARLYIRLPGGFRVAVGSRQVDESEWRLRKAAALVKLLALAPGHRLHREQMMDALWRELERVMHFRGCGR